MTNRPTILISAPTNAIKSYCQNRWLNHINNFTYSNIKLLLVDNSKDVNNKNTIVEYLKKINFKYPYKIEHRYPKHTFRDTLLDCSIYMRNYFINNDFDYMLSLESDVFIPYNIIEHLLSLNTFVIGLPYFHGLMNDRFLLDSSINKVNGYTLSIEHHNLESFLNCNGTIRQSWQSGIGCLLIKREVLKKINFRLSYNIDNIGFPDKYFFDDLLNNGYRCYLDTRFIATHENNYENWVKLRETEQ